MGGNKKGRGGKGRGGGQQNHNGSSSKQQRIVNDEMIPSYENNHSTASTRGGGSHSRGESSQYDRQDSGRGARPRNTDYENGPIRRPTVYRENEYQRNLNKENKKQHKENEHQHQHREGRETQHKEGSQHDNMILGYQECTGHSREVGERGQRSDKKSYHTCMSCSKPFNTTVQQPKCLECGHSFCTPCLQKLIDGEKNCPDCQRSIGNYKSAEEAPPNHAILELLAIEESNRNKSSKPIMTAGVSKPSENKSSYSKEKYKRSPHDSRCLEFGAVPKSHCATCEKWVCEECGNIDHPQQKGCYLIVKKEALSQMKAAWEDSANATGEAVDDCLKDMQVCKEQLDAYASAMQIAFESIDAEKVRIENMTKGGHYWKKDLEAMVTAMSEKKLLPDALASLKDIEENSKKIKQRIDSVASKTLDHKRILNITKETLLSAIHMRKFAESENKTVGLVLASHTISEKLLYARLAGEGGRIFVHALAEVHTVPMGSRAMPLSCVKSCLDRSSVLTFIDINWGGNCNARIYIRLLGDTLRGRQFLMLCTGEAGPSFRNTTFYRLWWKGCPAEHIWGGDYEKGDGSGGTPLLQLSEKERKSIPSGRSLSIVPGLVAGRYEKTSISTIFRIYTKAAAKGMSNTEEEVDEAAFGKVEYGLDHLQIAVNSGNVKGITICDCGVVIEP